MCPRAFLSVGSYRSNHNAAAAQDRSKNKSSVFFDDGVQTELKRQTGVDMEKIFKGRTVMQSESRSNNKLFVNIII